MSRTERESKAKALVSGITTDPCGAERGKIIGETMGSMSDKPRGDIGGDVSGEMKVEKMGETRGESMGGLGVIAGISESNPSMNSLNGNNVSGLSGTQGDGLIKSTVPSAEAMTNWWKSCPQTRCKVTTASFIASCRRSTSSNCGGRAFFRRDTAYPLVSKFVPGAHLTLLRALLSRRMGL